ncbi:MAG: YqgE/AlgH family protein [Phycisphaeraceae bacterium]
MEASAIKSLKGQLLVAPASLADPNFTRTVVLMIQHNDEGALGLILNRPSGMTVSEGWKQVSELPCLAEGFLHQGGPCQGPLMVLHSQAEAGEVEVLPGLFFSTEETHVEDLVTGSVSPTRCFVGYAGWSPGQVEAEIAAGGWLITPAMPDHVFADGPDLWSTLTCRLTLGMEVNPNVIPNDPRLN